LSNTGRPTKQRQVKLDESFHDCFIKGYDPLFAAQLLGVNKKTAYKYYKKIFDELASEHRDDFFNRNRVSLEQTIQNFDYLLQEEYLMLDEINDQLKTSKSKLPLFNSKSKILKDIKNILYDKSELKLYLPNRDKISKMVEEEVKNYVKTN
jgi:hypothetical protein